MGGQTPDLAVMGEKPSLIGTEAERDKRNEELKVIKRELLDLCELIGF